MDLYQLQTLRQRYDRSGLLFHEYHVQIEMARLCDIKGAYGKAEMYRNMADIALKYAKIKLDKEWGMMPPIKRLRYRKMEWIEDKLFASIFPAKLDVNREMKKP